VRALSPSGRVHGRLLILTEKVKLFTIVTTQTSPLLCWRMGVWGVWRSRSDRHTPQTPVYPLQTGSRLSSYLKSTYCVATLDAPF